MFEYAGSQHCRQCGRPAERYIQEAIGRITYWCSVHGMRCCQEVFPVLLKPTLPTVEPVQEPVVQKPAPVVEVVQKPTLADDVSEEYTMKDLSEEVSGVWKLNDGEAWDWDSEEYEEEEEYEGEDPAKIPWGKLFFAFFVLGVFFVLYVWALFTGNLDFLVK